MTEHISCDYKCKLNSRICNSNQKWNNKTCQCKYKDYRKCIKDYNWNPRTYICENSKFIKSIAATSMTEYDEIVIVMDNVSTKKTIATNVTSTASINCHSIKVRDCHILHTVLLAIILLVIIIIFLLSLCKTKRHNIKM